MLLASDDSPEGVFIGVDVVSIDRITADIGRWADLLTRRLLSDRELAWVRKDTASLVAACLAAKEGVIKALRERPVGFSWKDVELVIGGSQSAPSKEAVRRARTALSRIEATAQSTARCILRGPVEQRAQLLFEQEMELAGNQAGACAVWGQRGNELIAIVQIWPEAARSVG
jgi:holo-[acyl-carrier-protein] synthase